MTYLYPCTRGYCYLVVEPFLADSAADCPILLFFKPSRSLAHGQTRCGIIDSKGFPAVHMAYLLGGRLRGTSVLFTTKIKNYNMLLAFGLLIQTIGQCCSSGLINDS